MEQVYTIRELSYSSHSYRSLSYISGMQVYYTILLLLANMYIVIFH
jgi:hypothetical protein